MFPARSLTTRTSLASAVWGRGRIRRSTPSWRATSTQFTSVAPSRLQPIRTNTRTNCVICYKRRMRQHAYGPRPAQLKWLLNSDPAIRWQVMRDLTDEAPNVVAVERSRVATVGWGAQLLARQSRAGNWGGPDEDRGLLITLYSLVVLMDLGLDPASKQARKMIERVDKQLVFEPLNS